MPKKDIIIIPQRALPPPQVRPAITVCYAFDDRKMSKRKIIVLPSLMAMTLKLNYILNHRKDIDL